MPAEIANTLMNTSTINNYTLYDSKSLIDENLLEITKNALSAI